MRVEAIEKKRTQAIRTIRTALKSAGGTADIAVFHQGDRKRIVKALTELEIFWCEVDEKIYVNRHDLEVIDKRAIYNE